MRQQVLNGDLRRILWEVQRDAVLEFCSEGKFLSRDEFPNRQGCEEFRSRSNAETSVYCICDLIAAAA